MRDEDLLLAIKYSMRVSREKCLGRRMAANKVGEALGHEVAIQVSGGSHGDFATGLSTFWRDGGLGEIKVLTTDPLSIEIEHCYDCDGRPYWFRGRSCAMTKRILGAAYGDFFSSPVLVQEKQCCLTSSSSCVFEFVPQSIQTELHGNSADRSRYQGSFEATKELRPQPNES